MSSICYYDLRQCVKSNGRHSPHTVCVRSNMSEKKKIMTFAFTKFYTDHITNTTSFSEPQPIYIQPQVGTANARDFKNQLENGLAAEFRITKIYWQIGRVKNLLGFGLELKAKTRVLYTLQQFI